MKKKANKHDEEKAFQKMIEYHETIFILLGAQVALEDSKQSFCDTCQKQAEGHLNNIRKTFYKTQWDLDEMMKKYFPEGDDAKE